MSWKMFWKGLEMILALSCLILVFYEFMIEEISWFESITITLLVIILCKVSILLEK